MATIDDGFVEQRQQSPDITPYWDDAAQPCRTTTSAPTSTPVHVCTRIRNALRSGHRCGLLTQVERQSNSHRPDGRKEAT
jgi:hypothetical protein